MKRLLLLLIVDGFLAETGWTQQRTTLFAESLGTGVFTTIGIDQLIKVRSSHRVALNGGGSFLPIGLRKVFSVPVSGSLLFGKKTHFFEIGIGVTYAQVRQSWKNPLLLVCDAGCNSTLKNYQVDKSIERQQYFMATGRAGYRFQQPQGGWFFKVGFTPLMPIFSEDKIIYKGENPYPSVTNLKDWGLQENNKVVQLWAGMGVGYTLK
jgi:hypothetical protein